MFWNIFLTQMFGSSVWAHGAIKKQYDSKKIKHDQKHETEENGQDGI